ncbi:prepilin-type N-terminal cleavage/methylation domain-containing protein [Candidatus Saccharibacteria bacterium]|nr:prepilin-type N-terminal cleavage/methylation domain-containing protein [Candidatus Saccharibacteria bacterium]
MNKHQRGDTLVEVLIAITVLGIIVGGVMATMNRSMISILNSAERTATRADINTQTDLLNYVYRNDKTNWAMIMNLAYDGNVVDGSAPTEATNRCQLNPGGDASSAVPGSFYLEPNIEIDNSVSGITVIDNLIEEINGTNRIQRAVTGQGVWIDAVYYKQDMKTNQQPYIDFYIKACWTPLGSTAANVDSQSTTVVRIYDYVLDKTTALLKVPWTPPNDPCPNNNSQEYVVARTGRYKLEVWGAQGGPGSDGGVNFPGGLGGYSRGIVKLNAGITLVLHVSIGCAGGGTAITGETTSGGWNGGGTGHSSGWGAGGGGGATHIALVGGTLNTLSGNRDKVLIVAGGGAGTLGKNGKLPATGGAGGGCSGGVGVKGDGPSSNPEGGGGVTSGCVNGIPSGSGGSGGSGNGAGAFGQGGNGSSGNSTGGGGGWFGGGAGIPGGGGSGYVNTTNFNFTDYITCPGDGSVCSIPHPSGGVEIGQTGNGYARITYLGP